MINFKNFSAFILLILSWNSSYADAPNVKRLSPSDCAKGKVIELLSNLSVEGNEVEFVSGSLNFSPGSILGRFSGVVRISGSKELNVSTHVGLTVVGSCSLVGTAGPLFMRDSNAQVILSLKDGDRSVLNLVEKINHDGEFNVCSIAWYIDQGQGDQFFKWVKAPTTASASNKCQ